VDTLGANHVCRVDTIVQYGRCRELDRLTCDPRIEPDAMRPRTTVALEARPPVTLAAGEVLFIPAGVIHAARNVGTGNGAELATYVVENGKPLVDMVR
jgi:hypothetical protein